MPVVPQGTDSLMEQRTKAPRHHSPVGQGQGGARCRNGCPHKTRRRGHGERSSQVESFGSAEAEQAGVQGRETSLGSGLERETAWGSCFRNLEVIQCG